MGSAYFTDEQLLAMLREFPDEYYEQIAARLNVSPHTVANRASKLRKEGKFEGRPRGRNWQEFHAKRREELEKLCEKGATYAEMGQALGSLTVWAAWHACRKVGLRSLNPRGRRKAE